MERYCLGTMIIKATGEGCYLDAVRHIVLKYKVFPVGTFLNKPVWKLSAVKEKIGVNPLTLTDGQAERIVYFDEADIPHPVLVVCDHTPSE